MKISTDTTKTTPRTDRRALLMHHDPALLADSDVVAFLEDKPIESLDVYGLQIALVAGNEPALLVELVRAARLNRVNLETNFFGNPSLRSLHAGFLDHVLQHLGGMPGVKALTVSGAELTAQNCALLQATLQDPHCSLMDLSLGNCCFADASVQFPTHAPTVEKFRWREGYAMPADATDLTQLMPSLTGWTRLEMLDLTCERPPVNFAVLTHLLQTNLCIKCLHILSPCVPSPTTVPAPAPQLHPGLLLDAIKHDHTALTELVLWLSDRNNPKFGELLLPSVGDCLSANTTLQSLCIPGIRMCSGAALQQFTQDLLPNATLTAVTPYIPFGQAAQATLQRNQGWYFRLSPEFVIGAAEAFVQLMGVPRDVGQRVGTHLASTSVDRIYCGPVMALLCKATHEGAVRLRSACLRDALIRYIRFSDGEACQALMATMVRVKVELLPADKAAVVQAAGQEKRTGYLPAGYAG